MGRRPRPEIRQRLLDDCTDHALEHGLADRLEPFAAATGTSTRMLIYHFGTRDTLLRAVLDCARRRQLDRFGELLRARPDERYTDTLLAMWTAITRSPDRRYVRLFRQSGNDVVERLWRDFRRSATTDWLGPLEQGLRSIDRSDDATLTLAVLRGLLMDLDAAGDRRRVDDAFRQFLQTMSR